MVNGMLCRVNLLIEAGSPFPCSGHGVLLDPQKVAGKYLCHYVGDSGATGHSRDRRFSRKRCILRVDAAGLMGTASYVRPIDFCITHL